jgi:serine/threonine protein kinase
MIYLSTALMSHIDGVELTALPAARHGQPADLWAAGVVMYTLLAGLLPFDGRSTRETYANIRGAPGTLRMPQVGA